MRYMKDHPELWKKMQEKFAEKQLAEDFSKMDVTSESENDNDKSKAAVANGKERKCGKKCHGKHKKRREIWQRFMQHMFEEMNLHASTESEGDEGNHTDKCTEEKNANETEAACWNGQEKKSNLEVCKLFELFNTRFEGFCLTFPAKINNEIIERETFKV